jgi:magnesium chelatase family protein
LLDRFDLRVEVRRPDVDQLLRGRDEECTAAVAARVAAARARAQPRGVRANADLRGRPLDEAAPLGHEPLALLEGALRAGRLSARGANRVRSVARTVADLRGADVIEAEHLALAMSLRADPFADHERVAC